MRKKPQRFATQKERMQHEEIERQKDHRRRIFAAIEQSPPGEICEVCLNTTYHFFCDDCRARIDLRAGV